MPVIIKRVQYDAIAIEDYEGPTLYWAAALCIGATIAISGMTCTAITVAIPITFGVCICSFGFLIMISAIPLSIIKHPAYRVYSIGGTDHIIPKTTPEADQIAICKAAKEIEAELIEIQTREAGLEEMARKCK